MDASFEISYGTLVQEEESLPALNDGPQASMECASSTASSDIV
jgi:hypothetical protein